MNKSLLPNSNDKMSWVSSSMSEHRKGQIYAVATLTMMLKGDTICSQLCKELGITLIELEQADEQDREILQKLEIFRG